MRYLVTLALLFVGTSFASATDFVRVRSFAIVQPFVPVVQQQFYAAPVQVVQPVCAVQSFAVQPAFVQSYAVQPVFQSHAAFAVQNVHVQRFAVQQVIVRQRVVHGGGGFLNLRIGR